MIIYTPNDVTAAPRRHCGSLSTWRDAAAAAASGHQSVKKGGVKPPPTATHISVDSGTDDSADDDIERSVEEPSVVAASLVIASLIVVPLSVVLVITLCARLYRQGAALIPTVLSSCLLSMFTDHFMVVIRVNLC